MAADVTYYVYVDRTLTGVPFYVGKGTRQRVKNLKRNQKHDWVAAKHGIQRVVEFESSDSQAVCDVESRLIQKYKTYVYENRLINPLASNFTQGGDGTPGFRMSARTRAQMSRDRKGHAPTHGKSVIQCDHAGCVIATYATMSAARAVGGHRTRIRACLDGKLLTYLGFTWKR